MAMSSSTFSRSLRIVTFEGQAEAIDPEPAQAILAGAAHSDLLDAQDAEWTPHGHDFHACGRGRFTAS